MNALTASAASITTSRGEFPPKRFGENFALKKSLLSSDLSAQSTVCHELSKAATNFMFQPLHPKVCALRCLEINLLLALSYVSRSFDSCQAAQTKSHKKHKTLHNPMKREKGTSKKTFKIELTFKEKPRKKQKPSQNSVFQQKQPSNRKKYVEQHKKQ